MGSEPKNLEPRGRNRELRPAQQPVPGLLFAIGDDLGPAGAEISHVGPARRLLAYQTNRNREGARRGPPCSLVQVPRRRRAKRKNLRALFA